MTINGFGGVNPHRFDEGQKCTDKNCQKHNADKEKKQIGRENLESAASLSGRAMIKRTGVNGAKEVKPYEYNPENTSEDIEAANRFITIAEETRDSIKSEIVNMAAEKGKNLTEDEVNTLASTYALTLAHYLISPK